MNGREIYDRLCAATSRRTTLAYSTSFSMGVRLLARDMRGPIHAIYGFVRFADEIVDTFLDHQRDELLRTFERDTWEAIEGRISLNPILHSFQGAVHAVGIEHEHIATFLHSMRMDLQRSSHDRTSYQTYVLGSAEVVGLMCLRVFCAGDEEAYMRLRPAARRLGAAFQKINFLRDLHEDSRRLGRTYFPGVDRGGLTASRKQEIEAEIHEDLLVADAGIGQLRPGARFGVRLAAMYYKALLHKIERTPAGQLHQRRIRLSNARKFAMLLGSYVHRGSIQPHA